MQKRLLVAKCDLLHEFGQIVCLNFRGLVPHDDLRIAPRTKLHLANEHRSRNLRSCAPRKVRSGVPGAFYEKFRYGGYKGVKRLILTILIK